MIINMNGAKAPETPSPVLQEKTVTPETLPTVIGADEGYTGLSQVTVNPDSQLKAENIRSGKTIFGVDGTFVGNGDKTESETKVQKFLSCREIVGSISTSDFVSFYGRQIVGDQIVGGCADEFIIDFNDLAGGVPSKVLTSLGWWNYNFGVATNRYPCVVKVKNLNMIGSYTNCLVNKGYIGGLNLTESGPKICSVLSNVSLVDNYQLEVPEGITDLGPYTFNNVRGYNRTTYKDCPITVVLPATLNKIYYYSVYIMGDVVFKSATPPEAVSTSTSVKFFSTSSHTPTITVPKGSLSLYQNASYLSDYVDYIVEANE